MSSVYPNIDSEMAKRNMHYRDLAKVAGTTDLQMYRRLRGLTNWKLVEAMKICRFFEHPDVTILFQRG